MFSGRHPDVAGCEDKRNHLWQCDIGLPRAGVERLHTANPGRIWASGDVRYLHPMD